MSHDRISRELGLLREGGQIAEYQADGRPVVVYRDVPTGGTRFGLPEVTDVLVPVPPGYPAALIDLAGLPVGSPFLPLVKGGGNNQGVLTVNGRTWQLASYHPHNGGGGAPWNQNRHGFHTYLDHLIAWLNRLG
ncbi:MAG: E2/UBC family protein [Phycisphaerales bacterium]|nr:E2/UBC family protein [Phycisphaerales bacterium]